jgi:hypothetical protein
MRLFQGELQWLPGALSPGVQRGRGVMLATHPLLVPRLRKSNSYTSCHPNAPVWSVTGQLYLFTFTSSSAFESLLVLIFVLPSNFRYGFNLWWVGRGVSRLILSSANSVTPEPEGLSPHPPEPANGPYSDQGESTPYSPAYLPKIHPIPILPSRPRAFPPKPCTLFSHLPCVPRGRLWAQRFDLLVAGLCSRIWSDYV